MTPTRACARPLRFRARRRFAVSFILLIVVGTTIGGSPTLASSKTTRPAATRRRSKAGRPARIAAVGDLACPAGEQASVDQCHQGPVSDLLVADRSLAAFFALGDLQYDAGDPAAFSTSYEQSYGRLKRITFPAPGNHEYGTPGAAGYFDYFGARAGPRGTGWYSADLAPGWHLVVLNSNCDEVGCEVGSEQETWVRRDLAQSGAPCTIAIWHHPRFASGTQHGDAPDTAALWAALDAAGAELVLTGHEHQYERFEPLHADGSLGGGLVSFVVGTGGKSLYPFGTPKPGSAVRIANQFGYLSLVLTDRKYTWGFVGEDGVVSDRGSGVCH